MCDRVRIAVIDDHPLFRRGVIHTLGSDADMDVVGEGATAADAIGIWSGERPDMMLLDVSMPGGGIEAAREIRRLCSKVKLVVLTVSENEQDVAVALQIGVNGYVLKGSSGPELLQIMKMIWAGQSYITPAFAARLLAQPKQQLPETLVRSDIASLTFREKQVLDLLSEGLMNKEIAHRLYITEKTVKYYMTELMQKLKVRNRVEAALVGRQSTGRTEVSLHSA